VRKLFWKLPETLYAWALKLDSSVCCTPGIKNSNFTRMSIVSVLPAAFRSITLTGFTHQKNYFLPKGVLQEVFRASSARRSSKPSVMVCLIS
jgi:acyl CoA:acetate/3-ketoacid CoA transferase